MTFVVQDKESAKPDERVVSRLCALSPLAFSTLAWGQTQDKTKAVYPPSPVIKSLTIEPERLVTIVHPRTFARWLSEAKAGTSVQKRKRGRPRKPEEVRQLVINFAREAGWGYRRIWGELKKLGIKCMSRSTVGRILKENGFDPGPKRGSGTWNDFIQRHIKTLWATDFFTKTVWTR